MTLVHASGIGDKNRAGVTRFAHKGMVRRVIGGHWGWSPEMQAMAVNNEIEAYNFSQGVICHLYREIAAQRPVLITKVGSAAAGRKAERSDQGRSGGTHQDP